MNKYLVKENEELKNELKRQRDVFLESIEKWDKSVEWLTKKGMTNKVISFFFIRRRGSRDKFGLVPSEQVPTPSLPTLRVGSLPLTWSRVTTPSKLTLLPLLSEDYGALISFFGYYEQQLLWRTPHLRVAFLYS